MQIPKLLSFSAKNKFLANSGSQKLEKNSPWKSKPEIVINALKATLMLKGRNPHKRTSWKLVGNPGHELVAN